MFLFFFLIFVLSVVCFCFIADEIESIQRTITQLRHEIDAFARLLAQLISLKCRLSYVDRQALTAYLCPVLRDGMEQGWEETVTASLAHLLKTALSKSGHKESSSAVQMNSATLEVIQLLYHWLNMQLFLVKVDIEWGCCCFYYYYCFLYCVTSNQHYSCGCACMWYIDTKDNRCTAQELPPGDRSLGERRQDRHYHGSEFTKSTTGTDRCDQ